MRKWILILAGLLCCAGIAVAVLIHIFIPRFKQAARDDAQTYLTSHFQSSVTFSDFHVSLYPGVRITIDNLVLRHRGRTDIPPLVEVKEVLVTARLLSLLRRRPVISGATLVGLQINTPPRAPGGAPTIHGTDQNLAEKYPVVIREVRADDAFLTVLRYQSDKPPNQWAIHHLVVHDLSFDRPAPFHAVLTNPKPQGEIDCDGSFGPWQADDPRETPVSGQFGFGHANLATLKGIEGTLSSAGKFSGPLDYLSVEGVTDTPNFALRISDHPVALHTDYDAIVDGTNGDTILNKVTAKFLHTTLVARGRIVNVYPLVKGRTIVIEAVSDNARIEDLLTLAVKADQPLMTGSARLKIKILIPEEIDADVLQRMVLDGQFGVGGALFTSSDVQDKIDALSRRGQGSPKNLGISGEASGLQGSFHMENETVHFSDLTFRVEGATIALSGAYDVGGGQMDFRGKLRTQAKLSQTVTGWKSLVLKPFDPLFKGKGGGAEIPIKITGTRDHPAFGTDFHDPDNKK